MIFFSRDLQQGTGKTSTILACARKINGPKYSSMILEVHSHSPYRPLSVWGLGRGAQKDRSHYTPTHVSVLTYHPLFQQQLNASDDRGIDVVREQIVNFASSRKLFRYDVRNPICTLLSIDSLSPIYLPLLPGIHNAPRLEKTNMKCLPDQIVKHSTKSLCN